MGNIHGILITRKYSESRKTKESHNFLLSFTISKERIIMYKVIDDYFKAPSPKAEVLTQRPPSAETQLYFQLLMDYGIQLNQPQKEAVATVDGPVLIVAGAGSGKTTVLTSRIGYMIHSRQIDPSEILLITYTRQASTEMIERLARIPGLDRNASRSVHAGTYHSICLRILRSEGYDFQVLSSDRRKHIMLKSIMKRMGIDQQYSAEAVANVISNWKNNFRKPTDIQDFVGDVAYQMQTELSDQSSGSIMAELGAVYSEYERIKEEINLYDFDDFLIETYYLLQYRPDILAKYQSQFKYVLCDEFQDTSHVQYEIIKMLAAPHNNLCIVGDDSQLIYGFRSAKSEFILNFDKVYPDCSRIIMDINYRSTSPIVGMANSIIHHNQKQIRKTLKVVNTGNIPIHFNTPETSDHEADDIVEDIKNKRAAGVDLRDIAVIYRTHATGRAIFDKLLLADIPFVTYAKSSESFYQNSFVKPMLSMLRVAINPMDEEAILDAAQIFYIKRTEMQSVLEQLTLSYSGHSPKDLFYQAIEQLARAKSGYHKEQLLLKKEAVRRLSSMRAPQAIREIRIGPIGYERQLEVDGRKTLTIHKDMVMEFLDECEQAARGFNTPKEFLSFIQRVDEKNKEMEELRRQPDIQAVRLMTIHASKGLEFDVVYAIGWAEGILPHQSSISGKKEDSTNDAYEAVEEERRLAYVCTTRAKRFLYLSSPRRHRNKEVQISRFLIEGTGSSIVTAEERGRAM